MEEELNIAAILNDKPRDTKLWSPIFGECEVRHINDDIDNSVSVVSTYSLNSYEFIKDGRFSEKGEMCLFPSKKMRSWEKFAWKKGEVLYSAGLKEYCVFNKFISDDYLVFISKYNVDENIKRVVPKTYDPDKNTADYEKVSDEIAAEIISLIEEYYGGKLNLETLQIEKQPEFKDGDIVVAEGKDKDKKIFIFRYKVRDSNNDEHGYKSYIAFNSDGSLLNAMYFYIREDIVYRLATDLEQQKLFDALAKENKAWDEEKKAIVDLPKKCEFEPFQKVLVRDTTAYNEWRPAFFHKYKDSKYFTVDGCSWEQCIPYNDSTKHLLGTTDEWKG